MSAFDALILGARAPGRTALTADWVLGHGPGGHRLLPRGEVVFEGGRIVHVGGPFPGEVARRIDAGRALVAPGFVDLDALSDLDTTTLAVERGPSWASGRVWPQSYVEAGPYEMYSPDELAFQKRFAFAQLLLNGITTAAPIASLFYREWGETVAEFDAAVRAAADLGLRVYLGPAYRAGGMVVTAPGVLEARFDEARGMAGLAEAEAFIRRHAGTHGGLIQGLLAPDRVETCTLGLLRATMDAANTLDVPVRLHCAQGTMERRTVERLHGCTAPEWLARAGLLGPRLMAPHATHATAGDLDLYADHGVSVIHCPLVSARFGEALDSLPSLRARGITVAMGTDTAPPDMVLNMAVGQMMARHVAPDRPATAAEMFDAATLGGAAALGRDDLGRLAPGACADIAVFDLSDAYMAPTIDPVRTLVQGATGRVTRAVFVDGRLSMRDGQVAGMDMAAARIRAQAQFDGLVARYPDRTWGHPPVAEIFPPSYPLEVPDA
ncbi:chlorohydrolase family protein [Rhodobaculum claviforme]|uniref:N-ethylammeline chlorohydrolase n=1 Tax=Rhodobaculum claviforme TaxID=1549854 RepID=A0A934WHI7_9RHOB|nr:chlorohydrolase family protein [Rhodobaculum claviforme]MBK5925921.1 N-ethylammeline chlorohydrolase [Rhodobaculum claviforme]